MTHWTSFPAIILIIFHETTYHRPETSHYTPLLTRTHLHHRHVPLLGSGEKTAAAVVEREEDQVSAALLDEELW